MQRGWADVGIAWASLERGLKSFHRAGKQTAGLEREIQAYIFEKEVGVCNGFKIHSQNLCHSSLKEVSAHPCTFHRGEPGDGDDAA